MYPPPLPPKPHRGTVILVLGILSLCMCHPIGIAAWIMGNTDLREMSLGFMDPSGRETTNAGRICGIISSVITGLFLLLLFLWLTLMILGISVGIFAGGSGQH